MVETHGENFYDREKMKYDAKQQANSCYDQQYGNNQGGDSGYQQGGGDSGYQQGGGDSGYQQGGGDSGNY